MERRHVLVGVGLAVVAGAGIYGLTLPEPERPTDPFAELPIDHPLRQLVGVYEVETVIFGPCGRPQKVPVPESAPYFGFRVVFQEIVGKPCTSVAACQAMIDPTTPFRFSPTPSVPISEGSPEELELSLPELLAASLNISRGDGSTFSGASTATTSFPGPDGASQCISVVVGSNVLRTDDRLVVSRQWLASGPAPGRSCIEAEPRCVQSVELTLRPVGP